MAQIRKASITPKMYRHFAAITVALTLTLGLFANGEGRQALADEVEGRVAAHQEARRIEEAQIAKFGKPKLIARNSRRDSAWGYGGYGDAFDSDYGKPSDGSSAGSIAGTRMGRVSPSAKVPSSYAPYGISQAAWQAMTEEEREEFLRSRTKPQPVVSAEQHRRQVEGLLAASAARAGEAGEEGE